MAYAIYMLTGRTDEHAMKEGFVARGKRNPKNVRRGDRHEAIRFETPEEAEAFIAELAAKGLWHKGTSFEPGRVNVFTVWTR